MSMKSGEEEDKATGVSIDIVIRDAESREDLVGHEIGDALEGVDLERVVDTDLREFSRFYTSTLGNDKLSDFERAAIKTYLWWKTHPEV